MTERVVDLSRVYEGLNLVARAQRLAVDRASASIAKERAESIVKVVGYSAAAFALIIVSVGVAIWLARQRPIVENRQATHPPQQTGLQSPQPAPPTTAAVMPPHKVKTNVVQFNSIDNNDLKLSNRHLSELTAGHKFSTSSADRWDTAWCYAEFRRDGLAYTLRLENRVGITNIPRAATEAERRQLELSEADVAYLRARCPWKPQ
jgi:hypothetical protein